MEEGDGGKETVGRGKKRETVGRRWKRETVGRRRWEGEACANRLL